MWINVKTGYPICKKINGYWQSVPVIIYRPDIIDGSNGICGAFFQWTGGDKETFWNPKTKKHARRKRKTPTFTTDEGLIYSGVTHWRYMPNPPSTVE